MKWKRTKSLARFRVRNAGFAWAAARKRKRTTKAARCVVYAIAVLVGFMLGIASGQGLCQWVAGL